MTNYVFLSSIKTSELSAILAGAGETQEVRKGAITSAIARGELTLDGSFNIHPGTITIEEFVLTNITASKQTVDDYRNYWLQQVSIAIRNISLVDGSHISQT